MFLKLSQRCFGIALVFLSVSSSAQIIVIDDLGREIKLASPATRIVSLAPHNTENLFTAGAGKLVVGTVDYSDYPKAALEIPRVGGYSKINIEAILAAKPDLIIAWSSGNSSQTTRRLIDLGLPVYFSQPDTLEAIIRNIEQFSVMTDTSNIAAPKLKKMREVVATLKQKYAKRAPVLVFYQVWNQPLITLNGQHVVSEAFKICGAKNVFSDEPTIAPKVSIEGVIASNPQLILLAGHTKVQSAEWRQNWQKWPVIDAVKHNAVSYIDANIMNRPTLRFIEGVRQVCDIVAQTRANLR